MTLALIELDLLFEEGFLQTKVILLAEKTSQVISGCASRSTLVGCRAGTCLHCLHVLSLICLNICSEFSLENKVLCCFLGGTVWEISAPTLRLLDHVTVFSGDLCENSAPMLRPLPDSCDCVFRLRVWVVLPEPEQRVELS